MNIRDAKNEIKEALRAYHKKDAYGVYRYPTVRQRPILLIGPPGIGKTAIMEQIAAECGVGLVSYTMTHHTRQSAIGLPRIAEKTFQGERFSVTEYTLSEIITSVYECMEASGHREGILFLDEINCVSETLAPVMLQFLQNKQFGNHKVPEGWLIVAAGNPGVYNKSVREFDIVTLDRVRKVEVTADLDCWMDYAVNAGIHGAVLSYLKLKPERFYSIRQEGERREFVTARGWEDLSRLLFDYEEDAILVSASLVEQFLQDHSTAADFTSFYQVYRAHGRDLQVDCLLNEDYTEEQIGTCLRDVQQGGMEIRFMFVGQMLDILHQHFAAYQEAAAFENELAETCRRLMQSKQTLGQYIDETEEKLRRARMSGLLDWPSQRRSEQILFVLREMDVKLRSEADAGEAIDRLQQVISERDEELMQNQRKAEETIHAALSRAFRCLTTLSEHANEMFLFVSSIARMEAATAYLSTHPHEEYLKHCGCLVADETPESLLAQL